MMLFAQWYPRAVRRENIEKQDLDGGVREWTLAPQEQLSLDSTTLAEYRISIGIVSEFARPFI